MTDEATSPDATPERVYRLRSDALHWVTVEDEVVALDAVKSTYLATNDTGAQLWEALIEGVTEHQAVQLLTTTFDVPTETARADVREFIESLAAEGLLANDLEK